MNNYSLFDIIGPCMIGPSSSHTAGAAKLAHVAYKVAGRDVKKAWLTLYGSFAQTGRGHGTDKALIAGVLGLAPDDERLRYAHLLSQEADVEVSVEFSDEVLERPNMARIVIESSDGRITDIMGASIGGGNILITEINGLDVEFTGDYPTLIVRQRDVRGTITRVTGALAEAGINVAFMRVFRHGRGQDAYMVIETDSPLDAAILNAVAASSENVLEVRAV